MFDDSTMKPGGEGQNTQPGVSGMPMNSPVEDLGVPGPESQSEPLSIPMTGNASGDQGFHGAVPPPSQPPSQPPYQPPPSDDSMIHAMPEKFMGRMQRQAEATANVAPASGKRLVIIVVIVAIVLGGITAGAFYILNSPLNPFIQQPEQTSGLTNQDNTNQEPQDNPVEASDDVTRARDAQRVVDITNIAQALAAYYEQFEAYPQFLSVIPSDLLATNPLDPLTRSTYIYVAKSDRQSYELVFDVESSAEFKGQTLTKGSYKLTPDDFLEDNNTNDNTNEQPKQDEEPELGNLDADGDGLTLFEERLLRTSPTNQDTDQDGFKDATELANFYSPTQSSAVKLDQSGIVKRYTNSVLGYSFFYPSDWVVSAVDTQQKEILITSKTGEDFSITSQDNTEGKTVWEWYVSNVSGDPSQSDIDIVKIGGRDAVRAHDGLSAYVADGNLIYAVVYHVNNAQTINYPTIFNFIVEHLEL